VLEKLTQVWIVIHRWLLQQERIVMKAIRFIPTGIHAYFDYVGGIVLLAAPFIFGFFNGGGPAVIVPMVLGVGLILYSLLTNYELGIPGVKFIPMWVHLVLDFVASAFLALSPFIFGFINKTPNVWLPHIVAGIGVILLVLVTQTRYQTKVRAVAQ
jgi:hypothetical protein